MRASRNTFMCEMRTTSLTTAPPFVDLALAGAEGVTERALGVDVADAARPGALRDWPIRCWVSR